MNPFFLTIKTRWIHIVGSIKINTYTKQKETHSLFLRGWYIGGAHFYQTKEAHLSAPVGQKDELSVVFTQLFTQVDCYRSRVS